VKILVTGASGLIGSHLLPDLRSRGHEVAPIRRQRSTDGIYWNPDAGEIESDKLDGADAIVNLAGAGVAERWTPRHKQAIYDSRIKGTALLASAISTLKKKPAVFVCASAIGYYGDRGPEVLTENSAAGNNFLAQVCSEWEAQAKNVEQSGVRVVSLRFGIVLSTRGGALQKMLVPFQMGAGGRLGSGDQYMSWISIDDAVAAIRFAIESDKLKGPVNGVAPTPVTNIEFTEALGHVLHRPTIMPVPTVMAHLAFGVEMADQVLLASDRVLPEKLKSAGFQYVYPDLEQALTHVIHDHV
jgi:uncharacterized protein (TIGR01777 family)